MMNKANLQALEEAKAAKLKKMTADVKAQILKGPKQIDEKEPQGIQDLKLPNGHRLIISHSLTRALKEKFLKTEGDGKLVIDEKKII